MAIAFDYWSDPLCIWAFVAQPKLERLLGSELGAHLEVRYHVVPVFGSVVQRFAHGAWSAAGIEGRIEATRRIAAEHGFPEVTGEVWRTAMPASSWSPGAALKAVWLAEAMGDVAPGAGERYQWGLRTAFFVQNRNIAMRRVQMEAAEAQRLPVGVIEALLDDGRALAAVWEDHDQREKLGIQGSPTYVFDGGRAMFYGNFAYEVLQGAVAEMVRGSRPGGSACADPPR